MNRNPDMHDNNVVMQRLHGLCLQYDVSVALFSNMIFFAKGPTSVLRRVTLQINTTAHLVQGNITIIESYIQKINKQGNSKSCKNDSLT